LWEACPTKRMSFEIVESRRGDWAGGRVAFQLGQRTPERHGHMPLGLRHACSLGVAAPVQRLATQKKKKGDRQKKVYLVLHEPKSWVAHETQGTRTFFWRHKTGRKKNVERFFRGKPAPCFLLVHGEVSPTCAAPAWLRHPSSAHPTELVFLGRGDCTETGFFCGLPVMYCLFSCGELVVGVRIINLRTHHTCTPNLAALPPPPSSVQSDVRETHHPLPPSLPQA